VPTAMPKSTCAAAGANAGAIRSAATNSVLLSFIKVSGSRCMHLTIQLHIERNNRLSTSPRGCACRTFEVGRRLIDDLASMIRANLFPASLRTAWRESCRNDPEVES
jgi:DNA primase